MHLRVLLLALMVASCPLWGPQAHAQDDISSEINAEDAASAPPQGDLVPDQGAGAGTAPQANVPVTNPEAEPQAEAPAAEAPSAEAPSAEVAPEQAPAPAPEAATEPEPAEPEQPNPQKICQCQYSSEVPYRERRPTIGGFVGFQYAAYEPVNYQPDFANNNFATEYGAGNALLELVFGAKWNNSLGSLGAQFGVGDYNASAADGSHLSVIPVTVGLIYALDALFKEPYVVPYGMLGMYSNIYSENAGGLSVKGNSAFSEFYSVGLMFQLDWIDQEAHLEGYQDFGLENTFLYLEARSFLPASNAVPDFSTPLQFGGGLKIEF